MKLLSHNGHLLVRPIKEGEKIVSGIIIPKETMGDNEQIANGIIVIGSDKYPVGTLIYFNKLIPADIHLEEDGELKQFFALQESDVMFSQQQ